MSNLRLNQIPSPTKTASKRVGRGIGSGLGKTSGRGHKGQRSRSGGRRDGRNEGGQMPLHRRLPKRGFRSRLARVTQEISLRDLQVMSLDEITLDSLRKAGLLKHCVLRVKIFKSGNITKPVTVSGIKVSRGARALIESSGGKVL